MRLSLMGSRFLGRENSSHPGSSKKAMRPPEKTHYRPTFKGAWWLQKAMKAVKVVEMKQTKT
ncbi:hypothetical protein E2C01_101660 [Portunus trituberculatus]|uniref:Uncharacterized protein n=1 Tax=Portunus trituberculatus TaxID=210409 RepID=A0A5B7KKY1_PORTR|nr:hypothetical protein [Portunus trituberculatus]